MIIIHLQEPLLKLFICTHFLVIYCKKHSTENIYEFISACLDSFRLTIFPFSVASVETTPRPQIEVNPCLPSPCGPNSQCRDLHGQAVCSCIKGYFGSPPNCRPECLVASDCANYLTCIDQHCTDPCRGSCGLNTKCQVYNHNAVCTCVAGYEGDPFTGCVLRPSTNRGNSFATFYFCTFIPL